NPRVGCRISRQDLGSRIGRAVVGCDDLEVRKVLREKGVKRALEIARTVEDGQPDGDERLHEPVVSATRGCGTMRRLPDGKLAAVAGPFGCQKLSCPGGKPVRQNGDPLAKRITRSRSCQENQAPPYAGLGTSF